MDTKTTPKAPSGKLIGFIAIVILVIIVLSNSMVFVYEDRYAAIKRFNRVERIYGEPGLHFKIPFIEVVQELPKNVMLYDLAAADVLTADKKTMIVSSYSVWRITEPRVFLQNAFDITNARTRLGELIYNAIMNLISERDQDDVISARGTEFGDLITAIVAPEALIRFGIDVVDIQIKQFDLPQENKDAVFVRMISERELIAADYNARGRRDADIIRNNANRQEIILVAEARSTAEQLRGEGEREYMRILSEAYNTPERAAFYEFVRSMDALETALSGDTTIILPMDTPLMKWLGER